MSGADNKAIVLRLIEEVLSSGDLTVADELIDPNFALHLPGSQELRGTKGLKQVAEGFRSGFPDRHVLVEDVICEGDKVVVRVRLEGKHSGFFQGIDPTGKQVNVTAIAIFRIADGRIAEEWLSSDRLGLLQQIGAIAQPQAVDRVLMGDYQQRSA
jgi:predicted ester cyclase